MTTGPGCWRTQLEPARWLTCRVTPAEPPRDSEGRPDERDWLCADPVDADPADACLTVMVGWGGGGKYHHAEVIEDQQAVYVLVFMGRMFFLADGEPVDTVATRPRSEASAAAADLIAKFEDLQLIQATHRALAERGPRPN